MNNRLIKSNDAGGGGCTNTVDLYNPFPDGGGVALYQLNGDATDVSGNYNGTAANVTYGTGVFGQAGVFNGSSSGILINDAPALRLTGNYTVSFWIKLNSTGSFQRIINKDDGIDHSAGYAFNIQPVGNLVWVHNDGSNNQNWDTNFTPSVGVWYHLCCVYSDSANLRTLYVDGQYTDTIATNTSIASGTDSLNFGYIPVFGQRYNGSLDQVRFFSRALRPYEVEALYTEEYCTPTIVPSQHFNTVLYNNNNRVAQSITGVGFQPDFVWIKDRGIVSGNIENHVLFDSVRGVGKHVYSNLTNQEVNNPTSLTSFDSDGFSVGTDDFGFVNYTNRGPYVAWNFKAGGAAVTNTDGTITSQVSANTEAGFSIVTFTTPADTSGLFTAGHGLGKSPDMILFKNRTGNESWNIWHNSFTNYDWIHFDTNAKVTVANTLWGTGHDATNIQWRNNYACSTNSNYVAYCFAEVEGFSSIGSYVGTGASNTIVTGFEPAFLMMKSTDNPAQGYWVIIDNKRSPLNPRDNELFPNDSVQEYEGNRNVNFLSNGFELTSSSYNNVSGGKYIYMAFAADPTAVEPTLEDSFNTVLYTGTGASRSITGVGFQPDFTWIKGRSDAADYHNLFDSVRGADRVLISNLTNAEYNGGGSAYFPSFDSDGFSLSGNAIVNGSGQTYVAWNWKGAEIPAINSNGSIPSVVSANPAAGFSIVSYTANAVSGATVGHGLNKELDFLIVKSTNLTEAWSVYVKDITDTDAKYLRLNEANGIYTTTFPRFIVGNFNSNVFSVGNNNSTNGISGTDKYIAYCFAEVAGFSKFGSYTGTGASGNSVTTGFEPAFVMIKKSSDTGSWWMMDNKRSPSNPVDDALTANTSDIEFTFANGINFNATDFTIQSTNFDINQLDETYIYMAFANQF